MQQGPMIPAWSKLVLAVHVQFARTAVGVWTGLGVSADAD